MYHGLEANPQSERTRLKATSWTSGDDCNIDDVVDQRFRACDNFLAVMKWSGIGDYPYRIIRGDVSQAYKFYSGLLCAASLGFLLQSVVYFVTPSLIPDFYLPLKIRDVFSFSRYVILVWNLAAFATRLAMSTVFNSELYAANLRRSLVKIISDPYLGAQLEFGSTRQKVLLMCPIISTLMSIVGSFFVVYIADASFLNPYVYIIVLENVIHTSATMYGAAFCGVYSCSFVLPLLRITAERFEAAVHLVDVDVLDALQKEGSCELVLDGADQPVVDSFEEISIEGTVAAQGFFKRAEEVRCLKGGTLLASLSLLLLPIVLLTFQEAIACHDKCWELIRCLDRLASILIGINLSMAVPLFSVVVTHLDLVWANPFSFMFVVSWITMCLLSLFAVTASAARVNTAAHVPDEILTATTPPCAEFHERAQRFRSRFCNRAIGYTFFGFSTFRKESILTVLNIMTTYLIVGFQMKGDHAK